MDSESDFVSNLSKDILHQLSSAAATQSNSLKQTLEALIASSRTTDGRASLASREILPAVLHLTRSIPYSSSRDYFLLCLILLRNLCAGDLLNQNSFVDNDGITIITNTFTTVLQLNPDFEVVRIGLQVLANVSLAGQKHQLAIWGHCFPDVFVALAGVKSKLTCDPLCMLVYTCCDGSPKLFQAICDLFVHIVSTVCSVGFEENWFKLLVSRLCLEDVYFPVSFSKLKDDSIGYSFSVEQEFLIRMVADIVNERIEEISVPGEFALCVLGIFRKSVGLIDFSCRGKSVLPTDSILVNVLGYSVSIIKDICALEDPFVSEESVGVVGRLLSSGIIELFLSLLRELEPPAIIRKAMRVSEKDQESNNSSAKTCPYNGFRKDIVAVIGNCAYRRKHVQDEIRERNGILLLLQQCVADEDNPFLREWGIWSVRNLLEGNLENQQVVADLELQGSVDVPELTGIGLKVEVDQQSRRAKLVNVADNAS